MLGLKVGNDLNIFCNRFKPSLPLRQDTDVHSSALLFFREQVIWPSISTDLLVFHIEIQVLVFDADEANGQKGLDVENR